jgi:hypothetical protein
VQQFKYHMINKFSSIDNSSHKQKKYKELRGEIYLITSADAVWQKWKTVFERHESGDLIDPDTLEKYNKVPKFKPLKPLLREFFRSLQGLTESEIEKAATHMLHNKKTAKRLWDHPKIVITKPKSFVPSCYTLKEWAEYRKKKTTIVEELHKLVPEKQIFKEDVMNEVNWRAFKAEYNFTSASMAALMREAGEDFLKSKMVKNNKNLPLPAHTLLAFSNFIKEKKIVSFEGEAFFNPVSLKPLKIQGWPGVESRKQIRVNAADRFPFGLIDFRNIPGHETEGTMSVPFYGEFMPKFLDYASPRLREVDVWLWIVEDRRAEQVFELVQKLQPDYAVSKSHYVPAPAEGAYTTLKDKKTKVLSLLCLYFVFKANLLKDPSHPLTRMEKLFQVRDGMGASKSLYDEAKYAMYPADELRMEFYLRIMRALTRRGDAIFNIFGGTKPIFAGMVSSRAPLDELVSVARPKLAVLIVSVARPKLAVPIVWVARPKL